MTTMTKKTETPVQEEKLNIQKVHIDNKSKTISIIENKSSVMKSGKILNEVGNQRNGDQPAHQDLLDILTLFKPHFCITVGLPGLTNFKSDYFKNKEALHDEKIENVVILGCTIQSNGTLSISGGIRNIKGQIGALNVNNISLDLDNSDYQFVKELNILVEDLFEEVKAYFVDGKFGDGAQGELDLNLPDHNLN